MSESPSSINVTAPDSDLRIQIQMDPRYQPFVGKAVKKKVLGYEMPVAAIEDVLQGKIWAAMDETRRPSKRQKNYADIVRLVEAQEDLLNSITESIREKLLPRASSYSFPGI